MDRFTAMRAFVRIVERRSFTRASEDLGCRATVTDAIKALDSGWRAPAAPDHAAGGADAGRRSLYGRYLRLIADMDDAEAAFRDAPPRARCVSKCMARWAGTCCSRICRNSCSATRRSNWRSARRPLCRPAARRRGCGAAVGTLADSDLAARRLTMLREVTVAAPGYLQDRVPGGIASLQDGHEMVGYRSSATGQLIPWSSSRPGRCYHVPLPARVRVSGADAFLGAALAGWASSGAALPDGPVHRARAAGRAVAGGAADAKPVEPGLPAQPHAVAALAGLPIDWVAGVFEQSGVAGQRPLHKQHAKPSDRTR